MGGGNGDCTACLKKFSKCICQLNTWNVVAKLAVHRSYIERTVVTVNSTAWQSEETENNQLIGQAVLKSDKNFHNHKLPFQHSMCQYPRCQYKHTT